MFNIDPTNPVQAISAVKALQLANTQGQKIYQINQTNIDTILPKLNLSSDIINDIKIAISQGKEVTTHTNNVSVPGWNGAGYIIIDPKTGDGAYLISGGANGGFALIAIGSTLLWASLYIWSASAGASIFLGVSMVDLLSVVILSASLFIAAGVSAILGDSGGCVVLFNMAVTILATILSLASSSLGFFAGFFAKRSAQNICGS